MNGDTVSLIHRPFGDLVDDILTSVVGGVVNEPIRFDIKVFSYPLAEPAAAVRGITGSAGGAPRTFLLEIDFIFSSATNVVTWLDDGTKPDDASTFFVDYFRVDSRSPISDINVGSVTRTLSEAIGREIATVYEQINLAYLSAFIDTATGKSLGLRGVDPRRGAQDRGVRRRAGDVLPQPRRERQHHHPGGDPADHRDRRGGVHQHAAADAAARPGADRRAGAGGRGFAGDAGLVPAGAISEMAQPVAGVERVSNLDPTIRAAADETDDELRLRAKAALRALGKATLAALDQVIREGRGTPVEFFDPNSPPGRQSAPGTVTVVVDAEPERLPSLLAAVHDTRAAGVLATLLARYVFITPRITATITPGISAPGKTQIGLDIVAALQAYVDGLTAGDPADGAAMLAAIRAVADVTTATIVDVPVARADLSDPLAAGTRQPDRSLLVSTVSGGPATDAEIEAGTFRVSATVAGEDWWIALDMSGADIHLEDAGA